MCHFLAPVDNQKWCAKTSWTGICTLLWCGTRAGSFMLHSKTDSSRSGKKYAVCSLFWHQHVQSYGLQSFSLPRNLLNCKALPKREAHQTGRTVFQMSNRTWKNIPYWGLLLVGTSCLEDYGVIKRARDKFTQDFKIRVDIYSDFDYTLFRAYLNGRMRIIPSCGSLLKCVSIRSYWWTKSWKKQCWKCLGRRRHEQWINP